MSLHALATHMAQHGRGPDSMLVHMSPREVDSLQALAKANGGSLTLNPHTGLPEAGLLDSLLPVLAGLALGPAGFGLMSSLGAAATVGGITTLATGSLQKGLMAGLGAYGGAGLGEGLVGAGADALANTAGAGAYGATAGMTDAAAEALGYGSAEEAAQVAAAQNMRAFDPSAVSGFDKAAAGFNNVTSNPSSALQFVKDNGKSLLAATSPILAGSGVQTTTSTPYSQTPSYYRPFMYNPQTQGLQALTPVSGKGIKEGGLTSLCGGGAVAFDDGGFVAGGGNDRPGDYEKMVAYKAAQDAKDKAALDAWTVSETSPMYAGYMAATDQRKNDIKSMDMENTKLAAYRQTIADLYPNSTIVSNGSLGYNPTGDQTNNYITDANGKSRYLTNQDLNARDTYINQLLTKQGNYAAPGTPDVPAAGGNPTERANAADTNAASMPDVPRAGGKPNPTAVQMDQSTAANAPATTTPAPAATTPAASGIEQLVHGNIYDPVTGHYRNPTAAEIGAKGIAEAKNNTAEMEQLYSQYFKTYKPGEVLDFAGGTLTKNADGTATHKYTDANGKEQSYTFNAATDLATVANNDPAIAREWKSMFNYAPPKNTGSPIITTPGPTYPSVPIGGSGTPGSATTRDFNWQQTPIDRLPTIEQKKPEDAMSGESLNVYNALMGKGSTATKAWTTYPGRNYLPNSGQGFYVQRNGEAATTNPSGSSSGSSSGSGSSSSSTPGQPTTAQLNDKTTIPSQSPGAGNHWEWTPTGQRWVAIPNDNNNWQATGNSANGGLMHSYAGGGLGSLGGYSDGGRLLRGPGDGVSDSIPASIGDRQPARLADGEFVVPARIVSELGNGSTEAGARRLYQMLDRVQHARRKSIGKGNVAKNSRAEQYLPA